MDRKPEPVDARAVMAENLARAADELEGAGGRGEAEAVRALLAENASLRSALEPFARFGFGNVDAQGWAGGAASEKISDRFDPSDFRKACEALPEAVAKDVGGPATASGPGPEPVGAGWAAPTVAEHSPEALGLRWEDEDPGLHVMLLRNADDALVGAAYVTERGDPPRDVARFHCHTSDDRDVVDDYPTTEECMAEAKARLLAAYARHQAWIQSEKASPRASARSPSS